MTGPLRAAADEARRWLLDDALPFWCEHCVDRHAGGFHHLLAPDGAVVASPKRTFVQCRQIYVFAQAASLGWTGPWRDLIEHGLEFLHRRCLMPSGAYRRDPDSTGCDLYDQAFVAFAFAHAGHALGDSLHAARGTALIEHLVGRWRLPQGGFAHDEARSPIFAQNPHMHLFEAMLAICASDRSAHAVAQHARDLLAFVQTRLLGPRSSMLAEHYRPDWTLDGSPLWEPGHHFEWAWLLHEASRLLGADCQAPARALWTTGTRWGIDSVRDVAIDALDFDGKPCEASARLWPQAERLRAAIVLCRTDEQARAAEAVRAWNSLRRYLRRAPAGTFFDTMAADGSFDDRPVRASSLYHLIGAMAALIAAADTRSESL